MSPAEELERGRLAAEVLENPVFLDAQEQIRTEIVAKWEAEKDERVRDWLWTLIQASKRMESILRETMQNGQIVAKQIEMERSRLERLGSTARRILRV